MVVPTGSTSSSQRKHSRQQGPLLEKWLSAHQNNLYPTKDQKQQLADAHEMSYHQVNRWFANKRRKLKTSCSTSPTTASDRASFSPAETEPAYSPFEKSCSPGGGMDVADDDDKAFSTELLGRPRSGGSSSSISGSSSLNNTGNPYTSLDESIDLRVEHRRCATNGPPSTPQNGRCPPSMTTGGGTGGSMLSPAPQQLKGRVPAWPDPFMAKLFAAATAQQTANENMLTPPYTLQPQQKLHTSTPPPFVFANAAPSPAIAEQQMLAPFLQYYLGLAALSQQQQQQQFFPPTQPGGFYPQPTFLQGGGRHHLSAGTGGGFFLPPPPPQHVAPVWTSGGGGFTMEKLLPPQQPPAMQQQVFGLAPPSSVAQQNFENLLRMWPSALVGAADKLLLLKKEADSEQKLDDWTEAEDEKMTAVDDATTPNDELERIAISVLAGFALQRKLNIDDDEKGAIDASGNVVRTR